MQTALSHTQAGGWTFLPFWAPQQDGMNLPCHRAFLCAPPQRSINTFLSPMGCCGTRRPQEEPHTSTWKHVLQESRATGK